LLNKQYKLKLIWRVDHVEQENPAAVKAMAVAVRAVATE
jgi:hypothetical protein